MVDISRCARLREEVHVAKRKRRKFTAEFKAEVVALCRQGDRTVPQVARDLDLTESSVRNWMKQADTDEGKGPEGALTTEEKEELRERLVGMGWRGALPGLSTAPAAR